MDAKPQRPLRALRPRDENIPPAMLTGKTLHQRNKSTPALSTMLQPLGGGGLGGLGLKVGAASKRTAFADVSNTTRGLQPAKDDTAIAEKRKSEGIGKQTGSVIPLQEMSKPSTLLRPAQRPISVVTQKVASSVASQPSAAASTHSVGDVGAPAAAIGKVVTKRNTTIFREPQPSILAHPPLKQARSVASLPPVQPSVSNKESIRTSLTKETINEHVSYEKRETVAVDAPVLAQQVHDEKKNEVVVINAPIPVRHDEVAIALDKLQRSEQLPAPETYVDAKSTLEKIEPVKPLPTNEVHQDYLQTLEQHTRAMTRLSNEELARQSETFPVDEAEEYWDDEEDEEYYDADGYTTARSFKSRGDNTTGAVTIVLAPRVTTRVQKELEAARILVENSKTIEDIEDETWDTSMVAEYGDEIFDYMRTLEERMRPNPYYMDNQAEIQWSMRSVLIDWLVQVHHRFTLLPETLFLSVNYIDRFLSCKIVSLGKLQLVGATAIFVAAKYEEINCPSVQEIVFMVDGGYTADEILKAERFMLTMLQFELGWPGPMSFLRRISKADDYDLETRTLAKYFLEITIMDERFVACAPSFTAAGAHCLARLMLRKGDWTPAHVYYSNYTYSQLRQLISVILECCEDPQKHHSAVYEKYTDKRYKRASLFVEGELRRGFELPAVARESGAGVTPTWRRK